MFACASPGATPYRAALIDDKVISSQQGVKYAFVVKPDNTLERRNLETGTMFEGKRIVKSGLKDGEKVVSTRLAVGAAGHAGAAGAGAGTEPPHRPRSHECDNRSARSKRRAP